MPGSAIREKGWRQGSILQNEDVRDYLGSSETPSDEIVGIVITQSCDLVHHSLEGEPSVEILLGKIVDKPNPSFRFSKHPRKLHLHLAHTDTNEQFVELVPHEKSIVARELLKDIEPDPARFLPEQDLRVLTSWLAARYDRPALPDAFNDRIHASIKGQEKIAKRISDSVLALFIDIQPFEELPPEEVYIVNFVAVVPKGFEGDFSSIKAEVEAFCDLLRAGNVDVTAKTLLENKAPFTLITQFKRYNLDYLSLRQDPVDPMIVR